MSADPDFHGPDASQDAEEERTRITYTAWMRHGLEVARELAGSRPATERWPGRRQVGPPPGSSATATPPGSSATAPSPERNPAAGTWTAPRRIPGRSVQDAVETGWLVAAEPPPPTTSGPLAGLAVAVKDVIDVAGLPTRNGTPGALWRTPHASAPTWEGLEQAGAVCVGKSATHEMAWGVTTPQIPHPEDPEHISGGSSGGSAACVAAGVTPAALGTDTGGSIRIPAALCGVVGFRPTTGSVDMAGVTPLAPEQDVVGPVAADVATCTAMLEVLLDRPLHPGTVAQGMRVGILRRPGRLEPAVETAFLDTVETLREAGVEIIECGTALARQAGSISLLTMLHSSAKLFAKAVHQDPAGFGSEARALLTVGEVITEHEAEVLRRARDSLVAHTARLFDENELDAFLTPTTPCTAPRRFADDVEVGGRAEPVSAALTRFTAWASAIGLPAITVPVQAPGLPTGVQVVAPPQHEDVCVRLALTIEELTRRKAP